MVTGGHRFDLPAFTAMLDAVCDGWASWTHATQPEAQALLTPANAGRWSAVVLYDIAGLALARGAEPVVTAPSEQVQADLRALLDEGQGVVVLHHAIASWPAWDGWAHAVGGRYLYAPGSLDGAPLQASGYRMGGHTVEVLGASHPVLEGVATTFDVDDEIYLCPVFEHEVVPLLGTTANLSPEGFRDTYAEVRHGDSAAMCSPGSRGSRVVGWTKSAGRSPLVYLQPGHGPSTMQHPDYRRLLTNALRWVASADAHQWAAANPRPF